MDTDNACLANRRVSFAPEATLHTWNVVELPEDSTTSSASTNSTRRASGLTATTASPFHAPRSPVSPSDGSEPPSTPPEQVEELQVAASPAHQRDLHQRKRRRSSTAPSVGLDDPIEFSSSPASVTSEDTGPQNFDQADEEIDSSDSDDKDLEEDETVTGVDGDDSTTQSADADSTGSSGRLDAVLQQAARQAGTQGIDYDEHGDMSMEMADDEVTNAFKPWAAKGQQNTRTRDGVAVNDQENINPFFAEAADTLSHRESEDDTGTMEMTRAVGGILASRSEQKLSPKRGKRQSFGGRRRSSIAQSKSLGEPSEAAEDETMDLTMAIGGIQEDHDREEKAVGGDEDDEELTMEFTSVVGGMLPSIGRNDNKTGLGIKDREIEDSTMTEEEMDMTFAAGGILPSIAETTEPIENQSMEVTAAIGEILPKEFSTASREEAKALMELETDVGQLTASPFRRTSPQKQAGAGLNDERPLPALLHKATVASESGSPSLVSPQTRAAVRRSLSTRKSTTPTAVEKIPTPVKSPGTPLKQVTPQPARPTTPGKTPPSKNITMRTASPKKLFKAEIKAEAKHKEDPTPKSDFSNPLFQRDTITGATTPSIILQPRRRLSSGIGADREGLGSPRVSELLDRRTSIGDIAKAFVSQGPKVAQLRFEDPQVIAHEIDQQRKEDERRESGRAILQEEANEQDRQEQKDATINLKDMIGSLTPQKKKLKGRKSLHVGAARGLLGKRPKELDEDEDEEAEEENTTKRIKGREGSPVKKVRLPAPPPKNATIGRVTRATRRSLLKIDANGQASTPSATLSPSKKNTTPKDHHRFKDAEGKSPGRISSFDEKLEGSPRVVQIPEETDRIHLQDFLNVTNIRFMELTTTKRRHTIAPNAGGDQSIKRSKSEVGSDNESQPQNDLEGCVVAGTCTVPMLELYQHSCRELKGYIAEGRNIVKEIEADTYEENPPLFREYVSASANEQAVMDNQFKNVKTHARLLSKAMWYEWRMKLLEGLREGLLTMGEDMEQDHLTLTEQEQIIQPVLPGLIEEHDLLESEANVAQARADEIADCDQEELRYARDTLIQIEDDLAKKKLLVEEMQNELREKENRLEGILTQKEQFQGEIDEASKTLQACRGWSSSEVSCLQGMFKLLVQSALKVSLTEIAIANVDALESQSGWTITATDDTAISMTFLRTLELFFTPSNFAHHDHRSGKNEDINAQVGSNKPISLTYLTDPVPSNLQAFTTEHRFFLQILRAQLQCLPQWQTPIKDLLSFISQSWEIACVIIEESRILGSSHVTEAIITSDEAMVVKAVVLLRDMKTKIELGFEVKVLNTAAAFFSNSEQGVPLEVVVRPTAKVCYGEALKEGKMTEFLEKRIEGNSPVRKQTRKGKEGDGLTGHWLRAVRELEERCLARGKKPL